MSEETAVIEVRNLNIYYRDFHTVRDTTIAVTAMIGPSDCGKSTVLRSTNHMNDLIADARVEGEVLFHGESIYRGRRDPVEVRPCVGALTSGAVKG